MDYWELKTVKMFQRVCFKIILLLLVIATTACEQQEQGLPYYNTPDFTPMFLSGEEADEKITHVLTDFSLMNQYGKKVTLKNVEDKIHVADFFFTGCGSICPRMTNNLKKIQDAFEGDTNVVLLSYSVTPWKDDVNRLKQYAEEYEIGPQWHLLTGSKNVIYTLARQSYFAEEEFGYSRDSSEFLHTEHVLLIDSHKRIRGIYNGTLSYDMEQLKNDILALKDEEK